MRLTPRGPEVAHVAEAIDQKHPTLNAAAKAAIKAVAEALDLRDYWTIVESGLGPPLLWGVYTSEKEAQKGAALLHSTGASGQLTVYPMFSLASVKARAAGKPMPGDCACGHAQALHSFKSSGRGGCGLSTCECEKFNETDHPIPAYLALA